MPAPTAEFAMARAAARVVVPAAVPATAIAWAVRGARGGLTALAAVAFVAVWFGLSGLSLGWAARRSLALLQAVALGGFALRVGALGIAMVALAPVAAIDGPVLAITVGAGVVLLLTYEVWYVLRRADLWWVDLEEVA